MQIFPTKFSKIDNQKKMESQQSSIPSSRCSSAKDSLADRIEKLHSELNFDRFSQKPQTPEIIEVAKPFDPNKEMSFKSRLETALNSNLDKEVNQSLLDIAKDHTAEIDAEMRSFKNTSQSMKNLKNELEKLDQQTDQFLTEMISETISDPTTSQSLNVNMNRTNRYINADPFKDDIYKTYHDLQEQEKKTREIITTKPKNFADSLKKSINGRLKKTQEKELELSPKPPDEAKKMKPTSENKADRYQKKFMQEYTSSEIAKILEESKMTREKYGSASYNSNNKHNNNNNNETDFSDSLSKDFYIDKEGYTDHIFLDYESFPIYVETLTGTIFEVICSPFEPLLAIKEKIQRLEGIPVIKQHLIYQGNELKDNRQSIKDTGLVENSKITLVLDLKGGPISTSKNLSASSSINLNLSQSQSLASYFSNGEKSNIVTSKSSESSINNNNHHQSNKQIHSRKFVNPRLQKIQNNQNNQKRLTSQTFETFNQEPSDLQKKKFAEKSKNRIREEITSLDSNDEENLFTENEELGRSNQNPYKTHHKPLDPKKLTNLASLPPEFQDSFLSENLANSDVYLHTYKNGSAVLVVFEKRDLENSVSLDPSNFSSSEKPSNRASSTSLLKSSSSLIDDTRLNIKMRTLRRKMRENQINAQRRQRRLKEEENLFSIKLDKEKSKLNDNKKTVEKLAEETKNLEKINAQREQKIKNVLPEIRKKPTLPTSNLISPKEKLVVKNNHEKFCQQYNLTSPRETPLITRIDRTKSPVKKRVLPPIIDKSPSPTSAQNLILQEGKLGQKSTITPNKIKFRKKKCQICRKKVMSGMEFICRCGKILCVNHRLPELHECSFDHKMFGKGILKKENPVIAADKISKLD